MKTFWAGNSQTLMFLFRAHRHHFSPSPSTLAGSGCWLVSIFLLNIAWERYQTGRLGIGPVCPCVQSHSVHSILYKCVNTYIPLKVNANIICSTYWVTFRTFHFQSAFGVCPCSPVSYCEHLLMAFAQAYNLFWEAACFKIGKKWLRVVKIQLCEYVIQLFPN